MILAMAIGNVIHGFNLSDRTASLDSIESAVQQSESELQKIQLKSISKPVLKIQDSPKQIKESERVQYEVKLGDNIWDIAKIIKPENVLINDYVSILSTVNKGKVLLPGAMIDVPNTEDLKGVSLPNVDILFELSDPELLSNIKEAEGTIQLQSVMKRKLLGGKYGPAFRNKKFYPYQDSHGNWTIGYGHFLGTSREVQKARKYSSGITVRQANEFLSSDMEYAYNDFVLMLQQKKAVGLPPDVQKALYEMTFNMGSGKVKDFKRMWKSLNKGNYLRASKEMKNSGWAKQVGDRATRIVDLVAASHINNS
ncbi:hypothetical protein XaC1_255 [Xanthomonas phage XaC1]|nr:hypothetical protein XaC1_255 [Xanthomonas phage XaC1]